MGKYFKYVALFAVVFVAAFVYINNKKSGDKTNGIVYGVYPSKNDVAVTISAKGVVAYENKISISSPNSGRVESVLVEAGENLKAGQPLIHLEQNNLNNKIEIKRADLHAINEKILSINKNAEDLKQLFAIGGVARSEVEKNELDKKILESDKKKILLEITDLKEIKSRSTIRSPDSGLVITKKVVTGEWVAAGADVMSIAVGSERYIESFVDEYDVARLAVNQLVEYSPDEDFKTKFSGAIKKIGKNVAEGQSGNTVKILISTEEKSNLTDLKVGQQLYLNFIVAKKKSVLSVPTEYVFDHSDSSYVYVINNEKVIKKKVIAGLRSFMFTEIVDGVTAADKLVKNNEHSTK